MRHVGRGRIVLWEGASLWAFDVPPLEAGRRSTDVHAHHAIQFTLSAEGSFFFRFSEEVMAGPAVLIAPDVPHAYEPQGKNAMVFVDPENRLGAALLLLLAGRRATQLDHQAFTDIAARLLGVWEKPRPSDAVLVQLGQETATRLAGDVPGVQSIDARIGRVLERLSSDRELRLDAAAAANIACLSESRFSHLFVEEVGLPFRTYLLWRRLMAAVNGVSAGISLTQAAHEAGFADSAHFSRTFLRMFGVPASLLLMI